MTNDNRRKAVDEAVQQVIADPGIAILDLPGYKADIDIMRGLFTRLYDAGAASTEAIPTSFMEPATDEWPKRVHLCNAQSHFIVKPKDKKVWGCDREYVDAQVIAEVWELCEETHPHSDCGPLANLILVKLGGENPVPRFHESDPDDIYGFQREGDSDA